MELGLGNGARPCNYKLNMKMPNALGTSIMTNQFLDTLVKNTSMPGSTLNTREFWVDGHVIKLPGVVEQDQTWEATFYLDDGYYMRYKMENWIQLCDKFFLKKDISAGGGKEGIVGAIQNFFMGSSANKNTVQAAISSTATGNGIVSKVLQKEGYITDTSYKANELLATEIVVTQQSYTGGDIATCIMYNAFPTKISAIKFDDADTNNISEFAVTFTYSHHEYVDTSIDLMGALGSTISKGVSGALDSATTMAKNALGKVSGLFSKP